MELGKFSISLNVKSIQASKEFYEKLGFVEIHGDSEQGWLIMNNEDNVTIGLFQGMFDKNILTFNPGWDQSGKELKDFTDVRELQKELKAKNMTLVREADESTSGPASITLLDPDNNPILIDQHL